MSVFDEILYKLNEISNKYVRTLNDDIKEAFDCIDKFPKEYQNGRGKREQQNQKLAMVNTLMSINEDEDDSSPKDVGKSKDVSEKRLSNKRSKEQVDGMSSPEQEKRQKRNASVKAQNNIAKQSVPLESIELNVIHLSDEVEEGDVVNVNLTQKLRREDNAEKTSRRRKEDKENAQPLLVKVKQEKISLPPEPMELTASLDIPVKQEPEKDGLAMPPPLAPVPKPRKLPPKDKPDGEEEATSKRRTRTKKNTDTMPPPTAAAPVDRATRASRRNTKQADVEPPEPRPKRTRTKKKLSESSNADSESSQPPVENNIGSPADKPRPKRTRRGKKAAEKEEIPIPKEPTPEPEIISPKEERISVPDTQSPAIPQKTVKKTKTDTTVNSDDSRQSKKDPKKKGGKNKVEAGLEETQVISQMNVTTTISMDKTVVLPNGVYDHTDGKTIAMNETVVLDTINRDTMVLENPQAKIMDCTVVIEKDVAKPSTPNLTDDLSLMTDDNSEECSTPKNDKPPEPTSAVKAKVQQFEEMAARTTRTKTRAMAKKDAETENCTPPDKIISKQVLSVDTLTKMNNLIFSAKTAQISSSASKPTAKLPPVKTMPASASKVTAINKAREEQLSKDDARRKKEAMLEAKKEQQRRKREEKMAAAAAAREAAEKERRAAMQAAARDRMEKQAHADQGKLERMKEAERKKLELARKVAETEERRRAEEAARAARLAEEQRRADAARRKQIEESEAMKKEAAMMAKEIEKRQKEYLEKQKMKQRMEADKMHTPLKSGTPCGKVPPMEPVYMSDGFQHLHSDDDDDTPPKFPAPAWCKSKHRQLALQHLLSSMLVDRLFSVRVHSVDLRAIFPSVERHALKRTSSAVWRTPPQLQLSRVHESPV